LKMRNSWNLKLSRVVILFFATTPFFVNAQFSKPVEKFPAEERYLYPVYPGQPGSLAGTMGELRSTHFHSGIDIRTNNMIGWPVLASKSGYISRVSVNSSGYGNVLYITHPDGNTTLYAHLDKFLGDVGSHVLDEQYRMKASEIDLFFHKDQFTVRQGDTVALSGNTGSSSGPHLHFDIRDPENYALDPLIVAGFSELVDRLPPAAEKVALKTLDKDSRINDRFGRFEFYARRVGANYVIATPILASGNIGVEIVAKDKLAPRSQFYGGVNYIEMSVDSQLVFKQAIEKVNVAETRAIYTLMDFKTMRNKGTRFYKLYIDDGNDLKFYNGSPGSGKIKVNPTKISSVQIKMRDSDGNASVVMFKLKPSKPEREVKTLEAYSGEIGYDIAENTMMVVAKPCKESSNKATVYTGEESYEIEPDYYNYNRSVYLIDLRKTIPDSITVCGKSAVPRINLSIPSGTEYKFYSEVMDIQFPLNSIYDTLYLNTNYQQDSYGREIFTIGSRNVPLHKSIAVSLKPLKSYPAQNEYKVYRAAGRSYAYLDSEWINGRIHFNTREFGDFIILKDSIAPSILPLQVNDQTARFKIRDDLSGILSYQATIDGEWLLMYYDSKSNTIWSKRRDQKTPLKGDFQLRVTDNAGNESYFSKKIF
jgi:hypothetical protein